MGISIFAKSVLSGMAHCGSWSGSLPLQCDVPKAEIAIAHAFSVSYPSFFPLVRITDSNLCFFKAAFFLTRFSGSTILESLKSLAYVALM